MSPVSLLAAFGNATPNSLSSVLLSESILNKATTSVFWDPSVTFIVKQFVAIYRQNRIFYNIHPVTILADENKSEYFFVNVSLEWGRGGGGQMNNKKNFVADCNSLFAKNGNTFVKMSELIQVTMYELSLPIFYSKPKPQLDLNYFWANSIH